jgi:RNA polymerase sigma factor (sigma-70 family)
MAADGAVVEHDVAIGMPTEDGPLPLQFVDGSGRTATKDLQHGHGNTCLMANERPILPVAELRGQSPPADRMALWPPACFSRGFRVTFRSPMTVSVEWTGRSDGVSRFRGLAACLPDFCMGAAVSRQGNNCQSGRFRAGDETVLREVWQTYAPALARRLVSKFPGLLQPCDAEDLINAALDRAWRGRETFDSTKPFPVWLWSVVYTVAVSQFRRQGSRRWSGSRLGQETVTDPFLLDLRPASCPQENDGVPSIHHCGVSSEQLWVAVYRLPPNWQAIVRAHARAPNGRANNRLLAKELGLTVGTVREYHRRAMARLKHELGLLIEEKERERERERDVNKISSCAVGVYKGEGRPNVARVVSLSSS